MVDALAEIPIGSGGRQPLYPVAWQDVFGVWSWWVDAQYVGSEPAVAKPRIIALGLESTFAGSPLCPARLTVELSVDWAERTPTAVRVHAVYFPMTASNDPVPLGVSPDDPTVPLPAGCFRRDTTTSFDATGALSGGPDVSVEHLDPGGADQVPPGGAQGSESPRYRVSIPVPSLDFATGFVRANSGYLALNSGVPGRFSSRSVAANASATGLACISWTISATCSGALAAPLTSVNGVR